MTAMSDTTDRLPRVTELDRPRAFALISEAVWWVTIVDGTLVRYHPDAYDRELRSRPEAERALIEETLAGLRFVRNQMGHDVDHVDFIRPLGGGDRSPAGRSPDWKWNQVPQPACATMSPRSQDWELTRYRAYESRLAGQAVGQTFRRAADFLKLAAVGATVYGDDGTPS